MFRTRSQSGLMVVALLAAGIYFGGAWPWLSQQFKALGANCYAALTQLDQAVAEPVCGTVDTVIRAVSGVSESIASQVDGEGLRVRDWLGGADGLSALSRYSGHMQGRMANFSSARQTLEALMQRGPQGFAQGSVAQQFQQAIDAYAIGQGYLRQSGNSQQGLTWLKSSAAAPQGFGMLSQLSLAEIYLEGSHGEREDPRAAQMYLTQAQHSLALLSGNQSPQAQQMLKSLPASPPEVQRQIERAIKQLQMKVQ